MAVTFADSFRAVQLQSFRAGLQYAIVGAEAHGAAKFLFHDLSDLVGQRINDGIWCFWISLRCICVFKANNIAGVLNDSHLKTVTEAEVRNIMFAYVLHDGDFAFGSSRTKSA